jgi:UDP-N-acetylmuramoyl-L-alanyl-D-glutamate--2,6-diaminopimelate ligase
MSLKLFVRRYWHLMKTGLLTGLPATYQYDHPAQKLQIYGITGTDGKTTSSTLLYHVLRTAGRRVALISTVAAYIDDEEIDTGFHVTSPDPVALQRLLRRCVDAGIEHVVLEVTSHGLFQYRVWGVPFALAGITNVSPEHLDYFETWENLVKVKGSLLQRATYAVLNRDDRSFELLEKLVKQSKTPFTTYSQALPPGDAGDAVRRRFTQDYNQWNAMLVWCMAQKLGVDEQVFVQAMETFPGVKGRMEEVPNNRGIKIIVDFAHTPNALEKALTTLQPSGKGSLIAVFGCAGLRDRQKRPLMGEIASRIADLAIFTAEDPRTESLEVIFRQMKEGVKEPNHRKVVTIADRRQAIVFALHQAKRGDTVGIFGKGHERSMCFGQVETPWSDQEAVKAILDQPK